MAILSPIALLWRLLAGFRAPTVPILVPAVLRLLTAFLTLPWGCCPLVGVVA
jgi:hypothetical protein